MLLQDINLIDIQNTFLSQILETINNSNEYNNWLECSPRRLIRMYY